MTGSKLGFHIDVGTHHGEEQKIIDCQPAVLKIIHDIPLTQRLYDGCPQTIFAMRHWEVGDDFSRFGGVGDPIGKAREWMDAMRPIMSQLPKDRIYWEAFNEPHGVTQPYGRFEAERQRLMAAEGFKACIGNFGVGTPEIVGDGDEWPHMHEALAEAHRLGNLLGLHEYGGMTMSIWYGKNQHGDLAKGQKIDPFPEEYEVENWAFGRYRQVWTKHIEPNGWTNLRIVINETGLDNVATVTSGLYTTTARHHSWKDFAMYWPELFGRGDGEQFYVDQLAWADRQMRQDYYMVGGTVFTWGTVNPASWGGFEIEGPIADMMCQYIKEQKDIKVPLVAGAPQPPGEEVVTPIQPPIDDPDDDEPIDTGPGDSTGSGLIGIIDDDDEEEMTPARNAFIEALNRLGAEWEAYATKVEAGHAADLDAHTLRDCAGDLQRLLEAFDASRR